MDVYFIYTLVGTEAELVMFAHWKLQINVTLMEEVKKDTNNSFGMLYREECRVLSN